MKTLVAYFSHAGQNYVNGGVAELEHGNAEVLAGFAAQACGGDLFHIERVEPYPAEYKACVKESMAELKVKARPELARDVDVSGYDRVVVVFPTGAGRCRCPCTPSLRATTLRARRSGRCAPTRAAAWVRSSSMWPRRAPARP